MTNFTKTVLYTGITSDLKKRVYQHTNGFYKDSFSSQYKLFKLIWYEVFNGPEQAITIEKRIKGWTRKKKIALIQEMNPEFRNLNI